MLEQDSCNGSIKMEFDFDAVNEEDSPFPEVRASVSNIDDPEMPAMTLRMWLIGLVLCMTASAMNLFFQLPATCPECLSACPFAHLLSDWKISRFCPPHHDLSSTAVSWQL
jgi:hypothetical protein